MNSDTYYSRVYIDRPVYADYDAPHKFQAIQGIVARRLREHPNAICSYSGGADSDIMIDLIERTRKIFSIPPIKYVFFNTGLEMKATKDHVKATAEKYSVEITECRPKVNIVKATREHGLPFVSKIMSAGLEGWQKKQVPLSIAEEYEKAEDKAAKRKELKERYPHCESTINFLCCCNSAGEPRPNIQLVINSSKYMRDFISEHPPSWYKEEYGIRYSDAYEMYGLTRTGCCGCPISYKAVEDLEKIRPYEPNVVEAAWNIFGKSYEYRKKYNEYKEKRKEQEKNERAAGNCGDRSGNRKAYRRARVVAFL